MLFAAHVIPWAKNIKTGYDVLRSAFEAADKDCDITFAQYSIFNITSIRLARGTLLVRCRTRQNTDSNMREDPIPGCN